MERNVALLEATLQKITDHPELHDQSDYFTQTECGTVACFAGWACMLSNGQPWFSGANRTSAVRFPGDKWGGASRAAMHLLGLSLHEAGTLFDASNNRRMLELMVKDLVNGAELKTCDHYREETTKMIDLDRITHPLRLARGSHEPGSGKGCAMNVISYINGDTVITDYPECSAMPLARLVQNLNDQLAGSDGFLSPENSVIVLDLGWKTVGTAGTPRKIVWHWLADILVDPEMGVVKYAKPDGQVAIRRVADLCVRESNGESVPQSEWVEAAHAAYAAYAASSSADAYAAAGDAASSSAAAYASASAAASADAAAAYAAYAYADAADAAAYAASAAYAAAAYAADAYAAAADAAAYAASAPEARIKFITWAIQHWRDLAGLDETRDIQPSDVEDALARIAG